MSQLITLPTQIAKNIYLKSSEKMTEIENGTVQAVITSPPYWNLKDYKHSKQIGFGESYEKYHERLDKVWSECWRVLKPNGTLWIVIDKIMQHDKIVHIPYDITQRCRRLDFCLQDMIIWNKPTAIAGMSPNNLVNKYENVLFLSKSRHFKLNKPTESNIAPDYTKDGRLTDIWRFPVKAGSIRKTPAHEAPYPEELIRRIVQLSTDEMDITLDPFLGSGTTMKAALELNRRAVGYEINPDFLPVIADRLREVKSLAVTPKLGAFV